MVIKVAVPHQIKLIVIPDLKKLFFVDRKDIHYIGGSDILPAPLEAAAEKKAIKDLGTEKDENARKILIEHNLRLVVYIAKKFDNTGVGVVHFCCILVLVCICLHIWCSTLYHGKHT